MRIFLISMVTLFIFAACNNNLDGVDGDPENETQDSTNADIISQHLILDGATKVNGQLPAAQDGKLKINFSDTIYLMKGDSYKARISIRSEDASRITGFNVSINGLINQHYYDVPVAAQESNDSVQTIYIGFDPPKDELSYPVTFNIKVQPHGNDGVPLDEATRPITVEEPETCPITTENTYAWQWLYTMYFYPGDNLKKLTAPWFSATYADSASLGGYFYGVCCFQQTDGSYEVLHLGEGGCKRSSPSYKEMFIKTPVSLIPYEYLFLFENGNFNLFNAAFNINFSPKMFCEFGAYYNKTNTDYIKTGTYTIDANNYLLPKVKTSDPAFGPAGPYGTVVYSCHLLIFYYQVEGVQKYKRAYQRTPNMGNGGYKIPPDPMDYLHQWFDF